MTGIVGAALVDGRFPINDWAWAAGRGLDKALGFGHADAVSSLEALAHANHPLLLGVLSLTVLWTAVGARAEPVRLPLRQALVALLGWVALLTPLFTIVLVVGGITQGFLVIDGAGALELTGFFLASVLAAVFGFRLLAERGSFARRIFVLGTPQWAEAGVRLGPGNAPLFRVVGMFPPTEQRALLRRARGRRIWGIVVAEGIAWETGAFEHACQAAGVRLLSEAAFRERWLERVDIDRLHPGAVITALGAGEGRGRERLFGRRGADIALSLLLLFFSLPVSLLAALAIKLDSTGPVFYSQERVGLHGKTFRLLKFRSMRKDAERGVGPRWADQTDPRITRVGRFLRLARIDELPQLWNVLRGEMSLIGPRPERPYFVQQFKVMIPGYAERAAVKPGITGWAQVNYRYGASADDARIKLAYDLYYVKHRSALLDLRILLATVRVVLRQEGAR